MSSLHSQLGIVSAKLDKLYRRERSTSEISDKLIASGTWTDYSEVEKALDNWLKAHEVYWLAVTAQERK